MEDRILKRPSNLFIVASGLLPLDSNEPPTAEKFPDGFEAILLSLTGMQKCTYTNQLVLTYYI
jgi:hypothetical protein